MNALKIRVCPQCKASQVVQDETNLNFPHVNPCMQSPVTGTWWPADTYPQKQLETTQRAVPGTPEDGDDRYWDDEQAKAGR